VINTTGSRSQCTGYYREAASRLSLEAIHPVPG
jgi:hypothetical protein